MKSINKTLTKIIHKEIAVFFLLDNKAKTNKKKKKQKLQEEKKN
jgi:hypothetical protein